MSKSGFHVVLTSDHGSIKVNQGVVVGADRETSTGVRYKYGRNLNCLGSPCQKMFPVLKNFMTLQSCGRLIIYDNGTDWRNQETSGSV